jgi:hypothetical protein
MKCHTAAHIAHITHGVMFALLPCQQQDDSHGRRAAMMKLPAPSAMVSLRPAAYDADKAPGNANNPAWLEFQAR